MPPKKKPKTSNQPPTRAAAASTPTTQRQTLLPVTLPTNEYTKNLNRWLKHKDQLKVVNVVQPLSVSDYLEAARSRIAATETTAIDDGEDDGALSPLLEAPAVEGRDFRLLPNGDGVVQKKAARKIGGKWEDDFDAYVVVVRNYGSTEAPRTIHLYQERCFEWEQNTTKANLGVRKGIPVRGAPLEQRIVSLDLAARLGEVACQLLNRFPYSLNLFEDKMAGFREHWAKALIELMSITLVAPEILCEGQLHDSWFAQRPKIGHPVHINGLMPKGFDIVDENRKRANGSEAQCLRTTVTVFVPDTPAERRRRQKNTATDDRGQPWESFHFKMVIDPSRIVVLEAESHATVPSWFSTHLAGRYDKANPSREASAAVKLLNYLQFRMFGQYGPREQLLETANSYAAPFMRLEGNADAEEDESGADDAMFEDEMNYALQNTLDLMKDWQLKKKTRSDDEGPKLYGGKGVLLHFSNQTDTTPPSCRIRLPEQAARDVSGSTAEHSVYVRHRSRILRAHVYNEMVGTFYSGLGIPNMLQKGHQTADAVNIGTITVDSALQLRRAHVEAAEAAGEVDTFEVCMIDFRIRPRSLMIWLEDGRLVCSDCGSREIGDDATATDLLSRLRRLCGSLLRTDIPDDKNMRDTRKVSMMEVLARSVVDNETWKDGYNGTRTVEAVSYRDIMLSAGAYRGMPTQPSVDAVYPLFFSDGQVYYHHQLNVDLTTLALNYLKGSSIPAAMAWYAAAAAQWKAENVDGQPRNEQFWEQFLIAMDHCYMIRALVPYLRSARLASGDKWNAEKFEQLLQQMKSGVWQGKINAGRKRQYFLTRAELHLSGMPRRRAAAVEDQTPTEWEDWVEEDHDRMKELHDKIRRDPALNPKALTIPTGDDGAPWLWALRYKPKDYGWPMLFKEQAARYRTMEDECNLSHGHDTEESPETLTDEHVLQWYGSDGGKDTFLGTEMSPYAGMATASSYARSASVPPGTQLRTSWTSLKPTSLGQLDKTRRTMVVQAWCVNRMWLNFPPSTHSNIFTMLLQLSPSCQWYDGIKALTPFLLPTSWKDKWSGLTFEDSDTGATSSEEELQAMLDEITGASRQIRGDDSTDEDQPQGQLASRNLTNQGFTCYVSGPVQLILRLMPSLLLPTKLPFKEHSGRRDTATQSDKTLRKHRELVASLQRARDEMSREGGQLPLRFTDDIMRALGELFKDFDHAQQRESARFQNAPGDSEELINMVLDAFNNAGDHSDPVPNPARRSDRIVVDAQEDAIKGGRAIASLESEVAAFRPAHAENGNQSEVFDLLGTLVAEEQCCAREDCSSPISRNIYKTAMLSLTVPNSAQFEANGSRSTSKAFKITEALDAYTHPEEGEGAVCQRNQQNEHDPNGEHHPRQEKKHRKIIDAPKLLLLAISRESRDAGGFPIRIPNPVDVQHTIDLGPYISKKLPSEVSPQDNEMRMDIDGTSAIQEATPEKVLYELAGVVRFISGRQHYIAFIDCSKASAAEANWWEFDDKAPGGGARRRDPYGTKPSTHYEYLLAYRPYKRNAPPSDKTEQTDTEYFETVRDKLPEGDRAAFEQAIKGVAYFKEIQDKLPAAEREAFGGRIAGMLQVWSEAFR